jgi:hypothetical protein
VRAAGSMRVWRGSSSTTAPLNAVCRGHRHFVESF